MRRIATNYFRRLWESTQQTHSFGMAWGFAVSARGFRLGFLTTTTRDVELLLAEVAWCMVRVPDKTLKKRTE
jgi:hypothetical protein